MYIIVYKHTCIYTLYCRKWHIQATCATSGDGIHEALELLSAWGMEFKQQQQQQQQQRQLDKESRNDWWSTCIMPTKPIVFYNILAHFCLFNYKYVCIYNIVLWLDHWTFISDCDYTVKLFCTITHFQIYHSSCGVNVKFYYLNVIKVSGLSTHVLYLHIVLGRWTYVVLL